VENVVELGEPPLENVVELEEPPLENAVQPVEAPYAGVVESDSSLEVSKLIRSVYLGLLIKFGPCFFCGKEIMVIL
jgi:hypothetical protein